MTDLALFDLDETVPGYVHGIVSLDPPAVRCDGCAHTATGPRMAVLLLTCGIVFNPRVYAIDDRRLCKTCRASAWPHHS